MTARTAAIWGAAGAVSLLVAWRTDYGPTVFEFSESHGVHLGDLAAVGIAGTAAWWFTRETETAPQHH